MEMKISATSATCKVPNKERVVRPSAIPLALLHTDDAHAQADHDMNQQHKTRDGRRDEIRVGHLFDGVTVIPFHNPYTTTSAIFPPPLLLSIAVRP